MKKANTFVIGDIHGGLRALIECLQKSKFDNRQDTLICLGDYVDGWSESAEVIEYLINLQKEADNRHIFIKGNHDRWCEQWLTNGATPEPWVQQGGDSTIKSYIRTKLLSSDEHRAFFSRLTLYYKDELNRVFVHGGFTSSLGVGHQTIESDYYWDRSMFESAMCNNNRLIDKNQAVLSFSNHKEVFIGHTATDNWKIKPNYPEYKDVNQSSNGPITVPMKRCNVWNLDTGAGWSGRLTIMNIDTHQYWQSEKLSVLYKTD